jgi:hypothetical protein
MGSLMALDPNQHMLMQDAPVLPLANEKEVDRLPPVADPPASSVPERS